MIEEENVTGANQAPPQATVEGNAESSGAIEGELVNEQSVELGPAQEAQLDAYKDNADIAIYSDESQPGILQWLQEGENPIDKVSNAAFSLHRQLEPSMAKSGEKMTEITMALGAAHLVSELVVLASAAKLYELEPQDRLEAYRHSLMKYFEEGIKGGTIDAVELQKTIEPLMNEQQREYGNQQMEKSGISRTAPPSGTGKARGGQGQGQPQQQGQNAGLLGGA